MAAKSHHVLAITSESQEARIATLEASLAAAKTANASYAKQLAAAQDRGQALEARVAAKDKELATLAASAVRCAAALVYIW